MAGKLKSELPSDAEFQRANRAKIEAAVKAVRERYDYLRNQYRMTEERGKEDSMLDVMRPILDDFKTMLDVYDWLHSNDHHFRKYHAAGDDAWSGGEYYLGTECVNCEYSRSQQKAINDNAKLTKG